MDSQSPLLGWLQEQQTSGKVQTQDSSFTLTRDRAWGKLAAFQLPFIEAWIVKIVQGAVAAGAESIRVTQTWQETTLDIALPKMLDHEELVDAILGWETKPSASMGHFAAAIRVLAKGLEQPFLLDYGNGVAQIWGGESFVEKRVSRRDESSLRFTACHFSLTTPSWLIASDEMKERMVDLSRVLVSHCYACPIPLSLDGRNLNGLHGDPEFGLSLTTRPLAIFGAESADIPNFRCIPGGRWRRSPISDLQVVMDAPSVAEEQKDFAVLGLMSAFLQLDASGRKLMDSYDRQSQLLWVRDGVVVERESWGGRGAVNFAVLLSADGLETDISGFAIRKTEAYEERKRAGLQLLSERLSTVVGQIKGSVQITSEHPIDRLREFCSDLSLRTVGWDFNSKGRARRATRAKDLEQAVLLACERMNQLS